MSEPADILLVEDEPAIAAIVDYALRERGFHALHATSAEIALRAFHTHQFVLAIVDVGLPGMDGFAFCREVRRRSDMPLIILTAHAEPEERIQGFEVGVDDYVAKPFNPRELALRVQAVLGRSARPGRAGLRVGRISLDTASGLAFVDDRELSLSPTEHRLLLSLARTPDQVLTVRRLLEAVWGHDVQLGGRDLVKVAVYRLRKILTAAGLPAGCVEGRRGQGYVLRSDLTR
ncbi:MAG: response regulator transcription factor [Tessaracoccus sp.]|uniref:response regulator transcription factor n=1 Tax=Tessaracoccus sp. TaxID=1971211 RepID=UPI001EB917FC|nr:response regulator transcription factor [Tessaracoccus sp.]MBK7822699.1 response regulator transcription factor [Tessaracoccus sp.]